VDKRRFLEALGEAFLLIGPAGHIVLANTLAKELFQEERLEGRKVGALVCNQELLGHVQEVFDTDGPVTKEFTLSAANSPGGVQNGITAWHLDSAITDTPIKEKRILLRNVTQNYLTNQMRRDFVANASHELRTPLTIIVGYLENLMEDNLMEESPGLARKFIGVMHQNSQRLMNIIEDMLMISKLESGHKAILKEQWFHLTSCVDDVFSRLDSIREKKQAALHMNIPPDWELYGDPFYWTQVLFNLVENALKQNTEPGLSVTVAAARTPEACVITVTDTGVGIPAESLPFLFNRFYRVETHHSSEIKGTGLGLSIVKRAVEAHDGAITVSSTPHRETVFTITIPLKRFREEKEA
jgi:two-component system phosphate regulon sensor histidine kinase PhoR